MFNLAAAVNKVFSKASAIAEVRPHYSDLSAIFTCVENDKLAAFSHQERCLLQFAMVSDVLQQFSHQEQKDFCSATIVNGVNLTRFDRHVSALIRINHSTNFSENLHDWVDQRQTVLAKRLAREHDYNSLNKLWTTMDENGREAFLRYVMHTQHDIYSDDTVSFAPCVIKLKDTKGQLMAAFGFDDPGMRGNTLPYMLIDKNLLKQSSLTNALTSVVHEGIHSITRQLGMLSYHGRIPKSHPLYADAQIMAERTETGAYTPGFLGKAHLADLEERLAYGVHGKFMQLYLDQIKLRQQNRVTIGPRVE